ncbi:Abi family protein [Shewanella atlantica]|uniref:Abi family protein n=1 Tax=Shewanella atlantica TaxID=271099 RepID=A0A431WH04_9GAMM|nr:Abi family protein [Shewanella atlantica]RTR34754.1 Abi family protein [Shewanella atlantica]
MPYQRPWKSYQELLDLVKSRNMLVTDEPAALSYLERIGYYRLSAYWYPFREFKLEIVEGKGMVGVKQDTFVENTSFVDAAQLYVFDKQLRLLAQDALERIEVAIRVDIAHLLGERDTFAHHDIQNFHTKFAGRVNRHTNQSAFVDWQDKYAGLIHRSKEDFVKHYRITHGNELPIWVATEVWDFGALSQLFSMMKVPDQQKIATKYGVNDFKIFSSWLRSLNYLRNLVAHHSRLWNRNVIDQPKLPKLGEIDWCDGFIGKADLIAKPFLLFAILRHIMKIVCPNTEWHVRLQTHLNAFPEVNSNRKVSAQDLGLSEDWESWWE